MLAIGLGCVIGPSAWGNSISLVDIFANEVYSQTSGTAPTTPSGFFADVELTSQTANVYNTVSVAYPGPASPTSIPQVTPTFFSYGPSFSSLAAMSAAVPFGDYVYTATNSGNPAIDDTATLDYLQNAFTSAIPALSATSFNALSGSNPSSALTISFDSFTPNAAASQGFTFFTISDASGIVFSSGGVSPSTISLVIPANTLQPNTTYSFELDFSDRTNGTDSASGVPTLVGSDVRTDGSFTTGSIISTPEPASLTLIGYGLLLAAVKKRYQR